MGYIDQKLIKTFYGVEQNLKKWAGANQYRESL